MGSCLSSPAPPAAPTSASGGPHVGPTSFSSSLSSALSTGSKRWREMKKKKKNNNNKKKNRRETEGEDSDEIYRVSGQMFANGSSKVACLFTQQGKKGTNQDALIVWENYTVRSDTIFCGVIDGHGPYGHMVAKKVRDSLPIKLRTEWNTSTSSGHSSPQQNGSAHGSTNSEVSASISMDDECSEPQHADENVKLPDMYLILKKSLLKTFKLMDKELKLHPTIDCFCSGTTAATVIKQGEDLVIGNVGDSRAILGTQDKDNNLIAEQLTVDLKPNLPREAARIQQCKGRVFALQDEPEVALVWLPNSDSPGLAMARAFGDFCLKDYGLISIPDISYHQLTDKDEFIVLATDGVWDVLSNKEVVDIIASAPTRATAARALVECTVRAWRLKYPTSKTDDCAAVCLFFDPQSTTNPPHKNSIETPSEEHVHLVSSLPDNGELNNEERDDEYSLMHHDVYEIVPVPDEPVTEKLPGRSPSTRSLADCMSAMDEEEWLALEGVTSVNSLVNLPRFLNKDKGSTSWRKWL